MPTNNIARKSNLFPLVPYKGTYLILFKRICTSFIPEVIDSYLLSARNLLWNVILMVAEITT